MEGEIMGNVRRGSFGMYEKIKESTDWRTYGI